MDSSTLLDYVIETRPSLDRSNGSREVFRSPEQRVEEESEKHPGPGMGVPGLRN